MDCCLQHRVSLMLARTMIAKIKHYADSEDRTLDEARQLIRQLQPAFNHISTEEAAP